MPPRHISPAGQVSALNQNSGDLANSSAISFGLDGHGAPIDPSLMMTHVSAQHDGGTVEEEDYQDSSEAEAPSSGDGSPGARDRKTILRLVLLGPAATLWASFKTIAKKLERAKKANDTPTEFKLQIAGCFAYDAGVVKT